MLAMSYRACVFSAWSGRFRVHLRIDSLFEINGLIRPEVFASRLIVPHVNLLTSQVDSEIEPEPRGLYLETTSYNHDALFQC